MAGLHQHSTRLAFLISLFLLVPVAVGSDRTQQQENEIEAGIISPTDTIPADPDHIRDAWEELDLARRSYLAGELDTAYSILQQLATDTVLPDDLNNARRELSAYVLSGLGEHERAFDSLQYYVLTREKYLDDLRSRSEEADELRIQQINERMVQQDLAASSELEHQRSELLRYLFIAGAVIVLLLIGIISIALRPRKVVVEQPAIEVPAASFQLPLPTTPAPAEVKEQSAAPMASVPIHGEPMDASIMYDHTAQISAQLNKGATIEAAGHLGILLRFLRSVNDEMLDGHMPAQQATAFLRQYLKLEMLRSGSQARYTVDADRRSLERKNMVPTMALLPILAEAARSAATSIAVELNSTDVGEASHCVIKYPLGTLPFDIAKNDRTFRDTGLKVEKEIQGNELLLRVKWPEYQKGKETS